MKNKLSLLALALAVLVGLQTERASAAGLNLVAFDLYSSGNDGSNAGGGYRYSSNSNDGGAYAQQLVLSTPPFGTQTVGISFPLQLGHNVFNFAPDPSYHGSSGVDPGNFAGVNLYFNTSGTSLNPTGAGTPSDLTAYVNTNGGLFLNPTAGILVQDLAPGGGFVPYSGATSFSAGGFTVSVAGLAITHTPNGAIDLLVTSNIASVPEPASLTLLGLGAVSFGACGYRRLRGRA